MAETTDYILGTDKEELERLGFQHRVWSKDAFELWELAGLGRGQHILDLGCGPGFATFDLATITGPEGRVTGVDISPGYIAYARQQAVARGVDNVEFIETAFNEMNLKPGSFDVIYGRWVFAWINNVEEVVQRATTLLKPGGVFLSHEYLLWGSFRIVPERPEVRAIIEACRKSWAMMDSEIDIAPALPAMFRKHGLEVFHTEPIAKLSRPGQMTWQWPGTFLRIYSLKLIKMGLLSHGERDAFLQVWPEIEQDPDAMLIAPLMMAVAGKKL